MRRSGLLALVVGGVGALALIGLSLSQPTAAAPSAPAVVVTLQPVITTGLTAPVAVVDPGDGTGRLFIAEQGGKIRIFQNGALLATPFLDVSTLITTAGGEQGLLGLAFHPNYATNRQFFINYTDTNGDTVIARYQAQAANANLADTTTATRILFVDQPAANHNGGDLHFGPDGYLYIALGDGGGSNDTYQNGQNLNSLLAKILRIDVDRTDPGLAYAVPTTNPYYGQANKRGETWLWGLRNPWRFSFDRQTGDLFIGDVGQGAREEADFAAAGVSGLNYGWPIMEGSICRPPATTCDQTGLTLPINDYDHSLGVAITGGYRYRGTAIPTLSGVYVFSDYGSGRIWGLTQSGVTWTRTELLDTPYNISSFGQDAAGELYIAHLGRAVYKLADASPATATPTRTPTAAVTRTPTPTATATGQATPRADTGGVWRSGIFYLRNSNTTGVASVSFGYGLASDTPLVGDWNGDGVTTMGVWRTGVFYLRNLNTSGAADTVFAYGLASDVPVVGDWDGNGTDTPGVFRNGLWYLRNTNSAGPPDTVVSYGQAGDQPLVGDWDGDGTDTVGVWRSGVFYLRNSNTGGVADLTFNYGLTSDTPISGDWNADRRDTVSVYRSGTFYLRNTNTVGAADVVFSLGQAGDRPLAGDWDGLP